MKMTGFEKFLIRSPLRVYYQRKFEAPPVLAGLGLGMGNICLEIGCGHGAGLLLINKYVDCERVVGIDIDPDMVDSARKYVTHPPRWARQIRNDNIELFCQDAAEMSFPDGYFNAAFMFGAFEHIPEWREAVAGVYRVLKPGGLFSFEEFLLAGSSSHRFDHEIIAETELIDTLEKTGFIIKSYRKAKFISSRRFVKAVKE